MRLVAFNVDDLQSMLIALHNAADRWRPTARLKNQASRALNETFHREYVALAEKIGTALHQAEHTINTSIAIVGELPTRPSPENRADPAEPPRLLALNVRELGRLSMAMIAYAGDLRHDLKTELAKRPRSKDDRDYIRYKKKESDACAKLAALIARLEERARKKTAVNLAVE